MTKRVLVTGATGRTGSLVLKKLRQQSERLQILNTSNHFLIYRNILFTDLLDRHLSDFDYGTISLSISHATIVLGDRI